MQKLGVLSVEFIRNGAGLVTVRVTKEDHQTTTPFEVRLVGSTRTRDPCQPQIQGGSCGGFKGWGLHVKLAGV